MGNILVVGGTKGIGARIVAQLAADPADHQVTIIARNRDEALPAERVRLVPGDVLQDRDLDQALPEVLDGLVYCPGSIDLKPFHRLTEADFLADWNINFLGAVKMIQAALARMKKSTSPSIVLFSTVAVGLGMPFHASIAAAKGAVEGLTRSLAAELAPLIRVNCIAPSLTHTTLAEKLLSSGEKVEAGGKRHPLQRIGQPDEIATLACYLLSDKSGWMTGQVLHLDGGMSAVKM